MRAPPDALGVGRGIAIIAMMYGHALAPWVLSAGDHFSDLAFTQWKFGAAFLMVFFFVVSGISWREKSSVAATLRQSLGLIFIAWSASAVLEAARLGITAAGWSALFEQDHATLWQVVKNVARAAILGDSYTMATMWFLTTLALVRILAALLRPLGPVAMAAACVVLVVLGLAVVLFGWRNVYQVATLGVGLSSFLLGHAARPLYHGLEKHAGAAFFVCVIAGALTLGTFGLNQGCPLDMEARCSFSFMNDEFAVALSRGVLGNLPLFALTALTGSAFAMALAILVARYSGALGWKLAVIGRNTVALLVVNGALLEWGHPLIAQFAAPHMPSGQWYFYVGLFAFTLIVNLGAAALLHRPLKAWFNVAMKLGGLAVDLPRRAAAIFHPRRPRVSAARDYRT